MKKLLLPAVIFINLIRGAEEKADIVKLWSGKLKQELRAHEGPVIHSHYRNLRAQTRCQEKGIAIEGVKDSTLFADDRLVALAKGANVEIWDVAHPKHLYSIDAEPDNKGCRSTYSLDLVAAGPESLLACAAAQRFIYIFHAESKEELRQIQRLDLDDFEFVTTLQWTDESLNAHITWRDIFGVFVTNKYRSITPHNPEE